MQVGYIGLGIMGGALVRRLLLTRPLIVYDVDPNATMGHADYGAKPASSPADVARQCDVVMICVPRSSDVHRVVFGENGLSGALTRGKIIVDQTSGSPIETRAIAAELEREGIGMLDAPVSGGARGAEAGTIAIMVGGSTAHLAAVRPVLEQISPNIVHCGELGAGQTMKMINNTMSTCNRYAMLEGLALGLKSGLTLDTMNQVLNAGGARSRTTETFLPALLRGEANTVFALSLMLKDLNLATELALANGAPLPFGELARSSLQSAANMLGDRANYDDIANFVAAQAGTSFGPNNTGGES